MELLLEEINNVSLQMTRMYSADRFMDLVYSYPDGSNNGQLSSATVVSSMLNLAHFDVLIWPTWTAPDGNIPGWTGGAKWNYSKRSVAATLPERRSRD